MTLAHHTLEQAQVVAENAIGANDAQRFLMANTTPERDCLLDDYVAIRRALADAGIEPDLLLVGFVTRLRQIIELNDAEGTGERAIVGALHELATAAHKAERTDDMQSALTVRGLRLRLVKPLRVLADPDATLRARYEACADIDSVVRGVPVSRLLTGSLRAQLGDGPHDLLTELIAP